MHDYKNNCLTLENQLSKRFFEIDNQIFINKLIILSALLIIGTYLTLNNGIIPPILGIGLLGALYAHMIELQHQCLHGSAFDSKKANKIAGFLLGIPMLVSYTHYKIKHMTHHRRLGTPEDSEFFKYTKPEKQALFNFLLTSLSLKRFIYVVIWIKNAITSRRVDPNVEEKYQKPIRLEYLILSLIVCCGILISLILHSNILLKCWILPVFLISEAIHFFIELPEHYNCQTQANNIFLNSRTIRGSEFSFWFTNGNNYHVEHHLFPQAPIDKLPAIHSRIQHQLLNFNNSYIEFYRNI